MATKKVRTATAVARPVRGCDVCGGVDTDPRHVYAYALGDGVTPPEVARDMLANAPAAAREAIEAHVNDHSTAMRHMDCCAKAGCPDGTCDQIVADSGGVTGDELLAHLTKGI